MTNLATRAREISRFRVPVRIHKLQARDNSIHARLALADRIADLPRIQAVDHELETVLRILRRAYESLVDASAAAVPVGSARFGVVPNSSRTDLQ